MRIYRRLQNIVGYYHKILATQLHSVELVYACADFVGFARTHVVGKKHVFGRKKNSCNGVALMLKKGHFRIQIGKF